MSKVRKYTGYNRNERTIAPAATNQFAALRYTCEDQGGETVVSIHVELALNPEMLTDVGTSNVAGYARLVVNRAGNVIPVVLTAFDWGETALTPNIINDEDSGDTWAITPFAFGAGLVLTPLISGAGMGGTGPVHLTLSPKTKRSLRKGDTVDVEIQYSNSGTGASQPLQEVVTGTVFIQGD